MCGSHGMLYFQCLSIFYWSLYQIHEIPVMGFEWFYNLSFTGRLFSKAIITSKNENSPS